MILAAYCCDVPGCGRAVMARADAVRELDKPAGWEEWSGGHRCPDCVTSGRPIRKEWTGKVDMVSK